jgi:hypothetical protein
MTPTAIELARLIETSTGRRRRNVVAGECMVTPVKPLELKDPYTGLEQLLPGRNRLSPTHWAVRERPEWFTPCMKGDRATANRMRDLLSRAEKTELREIERLRGGTRTAARRSTPPRGSWRLPGGDSRPAWKLP